MNKDEYKLMEYARSIYNTYLETDDKINQFPDGTLVINKERGNEFYYKQQGSSRTYLSKRRNKTEIDILLRKKRELPELVKLRDDCRFVLLRIRPIVQKIAKYGMQEAFYFTHSAKTQYTSELKIPTKFGLLVRSKSEAQIANWFYDNQIPFEYEPEIIIDGVILNPDFRFHHPLKGNVCYLEHLGMNTPEYLGSWERKKMTYAKKQIFLGMNLYTTNEVTLRKMYTVFAEEFTVARYKGVLGYLGIKPPDSYKN